MATEHIDAAGARRRDFINVAAVSFAGVGAAAGTIPLIASMSASADVLAVANTEVDISGIVVGEALVAMYQNQPLFVRHLSETEIAEANAVPLAILRDPQTLAERTKPGMAEWLIAMGVCTHLGCVPLGARRQRTCWCPTMYSCHRRQFWSEKNPDLIDRAGPAIQVYKFPGTGV
ncbi:ubiquinol-cytochrome c reductase iron-sulfur subunit [Telmatospirillum sp.]|uniref:ubiquinol-cytochrome c reductase iron-sulfur subunit n=1 Tax=Telmatospirillum sp. TaxID=2079197 RepID=UPI0028449369|nr:ubiquinol-cytochrome c reductase iron-sulfur subunit [Telmatospirillum sp.]MDR3436233.1 ubiquinol-cytochrome c reductase iron-sulfur subunit [Telmatospirillum sp.]